MVKRLKELEERIVESEAWSEEEPLYSLMRHESLVAGSKSLANEGENESSPVSPKKIMKMDSSSSDTCPVPFSPRKALQVISKSEPVLHGTVSDGSPATGSDGDLIQTSKLTKLELFFRKLFRLLHLRLHSFSRKLSLSEATTRNIWDTMVYAIEREDNLRLLYGRHIDQLLICSIYGICKIMDEERKFKEIINVYREQPQFLESVR
jgi:retinoblastoma-associated protein